MRFIFLVFFVFIRDIWCGVILFETYLAVKHTTKKKNFTILIRKEVFLCATNVLNIQISKQLGKKQLSLIPIILHIFALEYEKIVPEAKLQQ